MLPGSSPLYQTSVLGEFSDAGDGVLFGLQLIERAVDCEIEQRPPKLELLGFGVDVARSIAGDLNAIASTWRSPDLMETTEKVIHAISESGCKQLAVDVGGPGGADRLSQLGYAVDAVHFGGGALDPKRFKNKRAEMFWRLREGMERGDVSLPDDDQVRADLSALRYFFTQSGQIQIESKDDCRKRLGRSPDRADALALAWASVCSPVVEHWEECFDGFVVDSADIEA